MTPRSPAIQAKRGAVTSTHRNLPRARATASESSRLRTRREDAVIISVDEACVGDRFQLRLTARQRERVARRRYWAAIAVALDSLRRAQARFDESSVAIDLHIQRVRAAFDTRSHSRARKPRYSPWRSRSAPRGGAETVSAGSRPTLSPAPSRLSP